MKKRSKAMLVLVILSVISLTGCKNSTGEAETVIDAEMTGFDDFMMSVFEGDQYLIVYGSQGSEQDTIRLKNYAEFMESTFHFPEDQISVISDEELTESDLQSKHIILLGNPETNELFLKVNQQLPITVKNGNLEISDAGWTIGENTATFTYLIPNPLNQSKYLWVIGATDAGSFPALRGMTLNMKEDEYLIKVDERTRYSGTFSKSSSAWTISNLEMRETIGEFESASSEHFVIRYSPVDQLTKERTEEILQARELIYKNIADQLGFELENRIDIDIYMTEAIMEHYVGRDVDYLSGLSYEVHKRGEEDQKYKEKIAKIFLGSIAVPLDQMTHDGLAVELASSQIYLLSSVHPEASMREIIESESLVSLNTMTGSRINPELDSEIVQEELRSFYHYLIEAYGLDKAIELYAVNANERVEKAIQTVYGKELNELEDEWIRTIK